MYSRLGCGRSDSRVGRSLMSPVPLILVLYGATGGPVLIIGRMVECCGGGSPSDVAIRADG